MPTPTISRTPVNAQQLQQQAQSTAQRARQSVESRGQAARAHRSQLQPHLQSGFEGRRPDFASRLGGQARAAAPQAPAVPQAPIVPPSPRAPQAPAAPDQLSGLHSLLQSMGNMGGTAAAQAKGLDGALQAMSAPAGQSATAAGQAAPAYSLNGYQETKSSFTGKDGSVLTYDTINMNFQPAAAKPGAADAAQAGPPKPISDADKAWLQKVGGNNFAEVQLGQLAVDKGTSDAVKAFGQHMVTDHGKGYADTQQLAAQYGVQVPDKMNADQQATYDQLSSLSGPAFDQAYTDNMTAAHLKSVDSYKTEAATTTDPAIQAFATKKLAKAEDHLADIQGVAQGKVPEDATTAPTPAAPPQGGFNLSETRTTLTTRDGTSLSYDDAKISPESQQGAMAAEGSTTSLKGADGSGMELSTQNIQPQQAPPQQQP